MSNTLKDDLTNFFKTNQHITDKFLSDCDYTRSLTDFLMYQCDIEDLEEEIELMFEDVGMKNLNLCEYDEMYGMNGKSVVYCFTKGKEKVYISFEKCHVKYPTHCNQESSSELLTEEVRYTIF